jgi:quercetin dioxygenase-like cupin family protein
MTRIKLSRISIVGGRLMRIVRPSLAVCAILVCLNVSVPPALSAQAGHVPQTTPLILEKDEGERRAVRGWPGHPDPGETFILKVDPKNGGSSHLVFLTADIRRGGGIPPHRHPGADEILFLESGTARVHLGDATRVVHAGSTVFIPANTWISVDNIGNDPIRAVAVFSAPGFEEFMRETSVLEGEKNVPLTKAENDAAEKKHSHAVIYKEP